MLLSEGARDGDVDGMKYKIRVLDIYKSCVAKINSFYREIVRIFWEEGGGGGKRMAVQNR